MSLLERDPNAPSVWRGEVPVTNRYTYGIAGERFFRTLKDEGRIFGTHCNRCDHTYVPAAAFCERCLDPLDEWVDVGLVGEVVTFTQMYADIDGSRLSEPEIIAFIKFEDGGIIHRFLIQDIEQLSIGMQAQAVLKPPSEREGSILDISHFELVND
jgi:uncharacterized OB-fold protein